MKSTNEKNINVLSSYAMPGTILNIPINFLKEINPHNSSLKEALL